MSIEASLEHQSGIGKNPIIYAGEAEILGNSEDLSNQNDVENVIKKYEEAILTGLIPFPFLGDSSLEAERFLSMFRELRVSVRGRWTNKITVSSLGERATLIKTKHKKALDWLGIERNSASYEAGLTRYRHWFAVEEILGKALDLEKA